MCLFLCYVSCFFFFLNDIPAQRHNMQTCQLNKNEMKGNWTCWWGVAPFHSVCKGGFLCFLPINCFLVRDSAFALVDTCQFWKDASFFEWFIFSGKRIIAQSIKGKEIFSSFISLIFSLSSSSSSSTQTLESFPNTKPWVSNVVWDPVLQNF